MGLGPSLGSREYFFGVLLKAVVAGALHPCMKGRPKSLDLREKRKEHRRSVGALSPIGRRGSVKERVALWKAAGDIHESEKH